MAQDETALASSTAIVWRRISDDLSIECAHIGAIGDGHAITGRIVAVEAETPLELDYRIETGPGWSTRSVRLEQVFEGLDKHLDLLCHEGNWRVNGVLAPHLAGCSDVDLGLSPSTNMLPIKRLVLSVGEAAEIRAAWVRFPAMDVVAARQRYERLDLSLWRYTNIDSGFSAQVEVDSDGLVLVYEGLWTRGAVWRPAEHAPGDGSRP